MSDWRDNFVKMQGEYAGALKEALVARRNETIDKATDAQLGMLAYNIVQWGLADMVVQGKLWRTMSQDIDFQSTCLTAVVSYFDKVSLDREPKEILKYLYRIAQSKARDQVIAANRHKRKHDDVALDDVVMTADFYGRRIDAYANDYDI